DAPASGRTGGGGRRSPGRAQAAGMSTLDAEERDALRKDQFAYVDSDGGEHLPIHDEAHVRNAISRFGQTHFEDAEAKAAAAKKVLSAAVRYGIEVDPGDAVAKARRSEDG